MLRLRARFRRAGSDADGDRIGLARRAPAFGGKS